MPAFIASVIGFFANLIKENSYKLARFTVLISVNTAFIAAFLLYIALLFSAIKWVYDKINFLLGFINSTVSDASLALGLNLLKASGVWDGLVDAFNFLMGGFVLLFSIIVTKYIIVVLHKFSNVVFTYIVASLK